MANKYEIEIGTKKSPEQAAALRQQVDESKKAAKVAVKGAPSDMSFKQAISDLNKHIIELGKHVLELSREFRTKRQDEKKLPPGDPGRVRPSAPGFQAPGQPGGMKTGGGRISLGGGMMLGGIAFAVNQIMKVGNAYLQKTAEQVGTAGIAGAQVGQQSYFTAPQTAEFVKSRRMAAGRYAAGGEKGLEESGMPITYAKKFGLGGGEVGRAVGLMERMTGGKEGAKDFEKIIMRAHQKGIETEMPLLISGITQAMEEAVEGGVNASNLALDMAKEVTRGLVPGESIKTKMRVQTGLMQVQENVAQGQISGMPEFRMMEASRSILRDALSGGGGEKEQEALKYLTSQGILNENQIKQAKEKGGVLPPSMERVAIKSLSKSKPEIARKRMIKTLVETHTQGMGGASKQEQFAQFSRRVEHEGIETDPKKLKEMFESVRGPLAPKGDTPEAPKIETKFEKYSPMFKGMQGKPGMISQYDIVGDAAVPKKGFAEMAEGAGGIFMGTELRNVKDAFVLTNEVARASAVSLSKFNIALMESVKKINLEDLGKKIIWVTEKSLDMATTLGDTVSALGSFNEKVNKWTSELFGTKVGWFSD